MKTTLLRVWLWFVLVCTFITIYAYAVMVHAQTGGGFPSRPQFQSLRVGLGQADPGSTNASISGALTVIGALSSASMQVGGQNVCVKSGSNCPVTTCTTSCSGAGLLVGQSLALIKGSNTSRASVTAISVDPDLQVTSLPAGEYLVTVMVNFSSGASTGGYKFEMANSTACSGYNASGWWTYNINSGTSVNVQTGEPSVVSGSASDFGISTHVAYGNSSSGVMVCWAQNTSNATATVMRGGTGFGDASMYITRMQ